MKINNKKLKRNSDIGDRLDLVPAVVMVISLFGIGIFYWFFRARFLTFLSGIALCIFGVAFAISFLLYYIGELNRRSAKKAVFNYADETIRATADEICNNKNVEIDINLSIKKDSIEFTLTDGAEKAACDLTAAKRLPTASIIFIDVCLGVTWEKIENKIADGKSYYNVAYRVIVNESPSPEQYFVKDGEIISDEINRVKRKYKHNVKRYKYKSRQSKT